MGMHGCMDYVWRGGACVVVQEGRRETQGPVVVPIQVFQGFAQKKKTQLQQLDDGCFEKLQKKPKPEEDA